MSSLPVNTETPVPAARSWRLRAMRMLRSSRFKLVAIFALCVMPVIASYVSYYVVKPSGRTNYGELIEPQRPVGAVRGQSAAGEPFQLSDLKGRWVMLTVDDGTCDHSCVSRLYAIRQVRATTGKDMERIERVLFISGTTLPPATLLAEYEGMRLVRADRAVLEAALHSPGAGGGWQDRVFVVDPLGNLMMRFPVEADPSKMKRDIAKLLRASRIG